MANVNLEVTYKNGKSMTYEGREMSLEEIDSVLSYLDKMLSDNSCSGAKIPLGPKIDNRCKNIVYLVRDEIAGINISY